MSVQVTRHFVSVGNRRVHYTRAGSGPAVCLFHPSPCSAQRMRPQQEIFASRFTALAFDTPGFGLSDKLPLKQPELTDFADAFAETLTALGIKRAAVYGNHTGAAIAVEFAARHPDRCAMALADGYPAYSSGAAEDRLKRYLLPLEPKWDGSHLLWLWYRYREQHVFWPWHDHDLAHRADTDVPDADFLHAGVIDLLDAGDDYRVGYAAAFRGRGLKLLPDLKVPVCFTLRPGDSLYKTKPMYEGTNAWVEETPRDALAATVREMELLSRHLGDVPPPAPDCAPIAGRTTSDYVENDAFPAPQHVRSTGLLARSSSAPVLLLHDLPGSSLLVDDLMLLIGRNRPVIAPDYAAFGEFFARFDATLTYPGSVLMRLVAFATSHVRMLGFDSCHIVGVGAGAMTALAALWASQQSASHSGETDRPKPLSVTLVAPPVLTEVERREWLAQAPPSGAPEIDGTHLLRVWHHLRDMELWRPWFDRRRDKARAGAPRIDPRALTLRVREAIRNPHSYAGTWTTIISNDLGPVLATAPRIPTMLMASRSDLFAHCLTRAAALMPHAKLAEIEDGDAARAEAIEAFLAGL